MREEKASGILRRLFAIVPYGDEGIFKGDPGKLTVGIIADLNGGKGRFEPGYVQVKVALYNIKKGTVGSRRRI